MGIIPGEGQHLSPVDLHDTVGHVDAVFLRVVNFIGETVVIIRGSGVAIGHALIGDLIVLDGGGHGGGLVGGLHLLLGGILRVRRDLEQEELRKDIRAGGLHTSQVVSRLAGGVFLGHRNGNRVSTVLADHRDGLQHIVNGHFGTRGDGRFALTRIRVVLHGHHILGAILHCLHQPVRSVHIGRHGKGFDCIPVILDALRVIFGEQGVGDSKSLMIVLDDIACALLTGQLAVLYTFLANLIFAIRGDLKRIGDLAVSHVLKRIIIVVLAVLTVVQVHGHAVRALGRVLVHPLHLDRDLLGLAILAEHDRVRSGGIRDPGGAQGGSGQGRAVHAPQVRGRVHSAV